MAGRTGACAQAGDLPTSTDSSRPLNVESGQRPRSAVLHTDWSKWPSRISTQRSVIQFVFIASGTGSTCRLPASLVDICYRQRAVERRRHEPTRLRPCGNPRCRSCICRQRDDLRQPDDLPEMRRTLWGARYEPQGLPADWPEGAQMPVTDPHATPAQIAAAERCIYRLTRRKMNRP
jgi:hypothetical protein